MTVDLHTLRERMRPAEIRGHTQWRGTLGDDGPPVLLLMGFGMPGVVWQPIIARLYGDHRVCWYDSRGMGRSSVGDAPLTMDLLADDAAALLDDLGWREAHVVGVSMGGMVAQHLALRHPGRVCTLSLIATSPGPFWRFPAPWTGVQRFLRANLSKGKDRLAALATLLYPEPLLAKGVHETVPEGLLDVLAHPAPPAARRAQLRAILSHDVLGRLVDIGMPALVVKPELDVLVPPRASDALADGLPRATLLSLPDAGHGALHQAAEPISNALRSLWR